MTDNSAAIQRAIDACSEAGGGRVIFPGGKFLTGTFAIKDGVELHIEVDGVILGSPRCEDYPNLPWKHLIDNHKLPRHSGACLIRADECKNVSITGRGTIDCNGESFVVPLPEAEKTPTVCFRRINSSTPPRVIMFAGCENVRVEGITMVNQPAGWSIWLTDCDLATFDNLKILADLRIRTTTESTSTVPAT